MKENLTYPAAVEEEPRDNHGEDSERRLPPVGFQECQPAIVLGHVELSHLQLARALDCGDDAAIWRCHADARDPELCLDWLAALAATVTRTVVHPRDPKRTTDWHCSLVALPFIVPNAASAGAAQSRGDISLAQTVLALWRDCIGTSQDVAVMAGATAYVDICRWSPVTQRDCLAALARQPVSRPASWLGIEAALPASFPQLHFLVGSVARWLAFPELPDACTSGPRLWVLQNRLAGYLGCHFGVNIAPMNVGVPALFSQAVSAGLSMWIHELARTELVAGWSAEPAGADTICVELRPADVGAGPARIPVRRHQLGRGGVELLLLQLAGLFGAPEAVDAGCSGAQTWH